MTDLDLDWRLVASYFSRPDGQLSYLTAAEAFARIQAALKSPPLSALERAHLECGCDLLGELYDSQLTLTKAGQIARNKADLDWLEANRALESARSAGPQQCGYYDIATGEKVEAPSEPVDHEPFSPMECCGRERDADGGPNPHCECPAPLKPRPPSEPEAMTAERWVPWAGTWVSFDGDEPEQVQELALDYGTIRLGSRWVAISMCRAANPRKGQP